MSYLDKSLIEGERIVQRARIAWLSWYLLRWTLASAVLLIAATIALYLGSVEIALVEMAIAALSLLWAWILRATHELAITNKRVISKEGVIARDTHEINLDKIEGLMVKQGIWGRIVNFGTIEITGTGKAEAKFANIADPLVFRRKFMEATDRPMTMPRP